MFKQVDIHGFTTQEVKAYLDKVLHELPQGTREVQIIHGYQGGNVLQKFVRNQYRNPRIERKMLSMNPGETTLVLYENIKKRG